MKAIIAVSMLAVALGACSPARQERNITGAAIGGVGGAVIGGVATGSPGGALVGGALGAATGAVIADVTRPRSRNRCYYSPRRERTVCRAAY